VTVGPFGDGINILHGPNEVGKSTLIEAAALAVFDKHGTSGQSVDSFQPWGTSLSPEITLEFEAEGERYRLQKTFLVGHRSLLSEERNGIYQSLHEGDAADTAVRTIMLGESPGRGRARPDQWGIARLLWSLQGPDLFIPGVTEPVADRLREALGGVEIRSYLTDIARRIEAEYGATFTDRRGDLKADSTVTHLRDELQDLGVRRDEARQAVEEVRDWADSLESLRRDLARLEDERHEAVAKVEAYRQEASSVLQTREKVKLAESQESACAKEVEAAQNALDEYHKQRDVYDKRRAEWRQLDSDHKTKQDEISVIEDQVAKLRSDQQEKERHLAQLRERLRRSQQVEKAVGFRERLRALHAQAKELEKLESRATAISSELEKTSLPTARDVKQAQEAELTCNRLRAQVETLGLQVTLKAAVSQTVQFRSDTGVQRAKLDVGEEAHFSSGAAATLSIKGVAEVEIQSGATEVAKLQKDLEGSGAALAELLSRFGVGSASDLAARQAWGKERRRSLEEIEASLAERANPYENLGAVRQQAAKLHNQLQSLVADLGLDSPEALASLETGSTEKLGSEITAEEKDVKLLQARLERRDQELQTAKENLAEIEQRRAVCAIQRDTAKERADEQLADAKDEKGLRSLVEEKRRRDEQAKSKTADLKKRLPPPESDPEELMKACAESLKAVEQDERRLRNQVAVLEANLQAAEAQGRYEQLAVREEEFVRKSQRLDYELTQAIALRFLRHVLRVRREETGSGALQGLEERVSRILSAVTNRTSRLVRLAPDFSVSGFSADAADTSNRDIGLLSAGTREQLWLSVRIALGETYAQRYGRQVMVLDDVLVYTDPDRHDRMLQVLRRAAEELQIFILTSRPSLYRGLTEPRYQFDMASFGR
jgi:DNA repair exonuclease SbcCD ATPase subunit